MVELLTERVAVFGTNSMEPELPQPSLLVLLRLTMIPRFEFLRLLVYVLVVMMITVVFKALLRLTLWKELNTMSLFSKLFS